jgi:hypothetical protein
VIARISDTVITRIFVIFIIVIAFFAGYRLGRSTAPGVRQGHQIQASVDAGFALYLHELADKVDADTKREREMSK